MLWKAWTYIYPIIGGIYLGVICNLTICATIVERERERERVHIILNQSLLDQTKLVLYWFILDILFVVFSSQAPPFSLSPRSKILWTPPSTNVYRCFLKTALYCKRLHGEALASKGGPGRGCQALEKKTRRPTTISRNKRSGPRSIVVANVTQLFCDFRSDLKSTFILWKK